VRDLVDLVAAGEPLGCLQPEPITPLLPGGRVPAGLRIPHASVIRPQASGVTTWLYEFILVISAITALLVQGVLEYIPTADVLDQEP
jgi:hypothetical protein